MYSTKKVDFVYIRERERERDTRKKGGSPGLVVMGGDSYSKGHEFESPHLILDGHFSHLFVVKIAICVWKDDKKWKRGRVGVGPFL